MIRWYKIFGYEQTRVINVEWLHAKHLDEDHKKKWLQFSLIDEPTFQTVFYNASLKQREADRRITNNNVLKSKTTRLSNLDHKYLLKQFNDIYR
jgi:hypothetical protein